MTPENTFDCIFSAILCAPGKSLESAATLGIPDDARALIQHQKYAEALQKCGIKVTTMAPDPAFPNACLIGNIAVMTDYLAVIGNFPECNIRQGEQKKVASMLAGDRLLKFVTAPGLLNGADVLRVCNRFYISLSSRTNQEGAAQLAFFLREYGYDVTVVEQSPESHVFLNASAAYIGHNRILIREELAHNFAFLGFEKIT